MKKKHEKILEQAKKHYEIAVSAESDNRDEMEDDLKFSALDQWPEEVKKERKDRPMLTLDHTGQAVRRVLGDIRQSLPSIKIDPVDDGSDKDTAEVIEGLVRQIEYQSRAQSVYMQAAEMQVKMGYGAWRVVTKYNEWDTFEQDIQIQPIKNPFTVYFDPAAQEQTKRDGRFVILTEVISAEQFEEQYGKKYEKTDFESDSYDQLWFEEGKVRVAEYFVKKPVKRNLVTLSNGATVEADKLTEEDIAAYAQAGITPVRDRTVDSHEIHYYKMTGCEILEESVWPGRWFPVVPVYGVEEVLDGRIDYRGVIRPAKDPQRLYNYWNSAAAETIALQPKAPFIGTAKQFAKYKKFWERANTDNLPYLPYDPDAGAPPPQRQSPPTLQAGLLQQASLASEDIKSATGIYDASLGARSNETSGIAIQSRQVEAEIQNSVFLYNLAAAIEQTGAIIVELIPHFYDTQRVVKIRGEDDSQEDVLINNPIFTPDGSRIVNDLTRGKYDVRVNIGPNYKTRRAEAAASMVELASVFPQLIQVAGDLVAKNLDWPGADEIAERLKKLLPPGIAEEDDPQVLQHQQAAAMIQQQLQEIQKAKDLADIENKQADTAKKITEAQKNEIENAVETAQLAADQQNAQLQALALLELLKNFQPTVQ